MTFNRSVSLVSLLVMLASTAVAGDMVVVKSTILGLSPGDVVKGENVLSVPVGKTVQLISQGGKTVTLNGPFSGKPEAQLGGSGGGGTGGGAQMTAALSKLLAKNEKYGKDLGATRDTGNQQNKSPWAIDVTKSSVFCLAEGRDTKLFRPGIAGEVSVTSSALEVNEAVQWQEDESYSEWPMTVPLEDGAAYQFKSAKGEATVTLKMLNRELSDNAEAAIVLDQNGCTEQALLLINGLGQ